MTTLKDTQPDANYPQEGRKLQTFHFNASTLLKLRNCSKFVVMVRVDSPRVKVTHNRRTDETERNWCFYFYCQPLFVIFQEAWRFNTGLFRR